MIVSFRIHYNTLFGQKIYLSGSRTEFGNRDEHEGIEMDYIDGGFWEAEVELDKLTTRLEYSYFLMDVSGAVIREWGDNHFIDPVDQNIEEIVIEDSWRNPPEEVKVMYHSAFSSVIMKPGRNMQPVKHIPSTRVLQFRIEVPRIHQDYKVCILGNQDILGNWDKQKPFILECGEDFPLWSGQLDAEELSFPLSYKYGIYDLQNEIVISMEEGDDRYVVSLHNTRDKFHIIRTDVHFRYPLGLWKGAGVSVPVFSLHSDTSFGVGEFNDLVKFLAWAKKTGLKMVQVLPVNETIASHNWLDSYPYKAISVMALHPLYLNLEKIGKLKNRKLMAEFEKKRKELNSKGIVDYPEVLKVKSSYYKLIYDQDGEKLFQTDDYREFFNRNKDWLVPYAAFVFLRDRMNSPDFRQWGKYRVYDRKMIEKLCSPDSENWIDISVHYFIQYHLDRQLKEAADFARDNGIILKGDIPIGVSPNSMEAWTEPSLFNLDAQAGAPPDDFAVRGQNWGFPTYNWEQMAKDNYRWWTRRMEKMSEYFDTYRIDHILGFFRIWEIPMDAVEAILGYFNPALPLTELEIRAYGIDFSIERYTQPYIRHHMLFHLFGEETQKVISDYLDDAGFAQYSLKEKFNTQKKINEHFLDGIEEEELDPGQKKIRDGLFELASNVLFISTGSDEWHPRISMQKTYAYTDLDEMTKARLNDLYIHYFYKRHNDFWYQKGMEKLPSIISVGNMLVCGEDLGMIPDCVPRAMKELGILSLEIQRMPKNPEIRFAHPADAPYLSVCTTSTHDMSTIRGWWEENMERTQHFYGQQLGMDGNAPYFAEPDICRKIIIQHLHSPAMWVTIPVQDLIAMDGHLRWDNTRMEQINHPANVRHRWRFKMKQSIEDLEKAREFNDLLEKLIRESGRGSDY